MTDPGLIDVLQANVQLVKTQKTERAKLYAKMKDEWTLSDGMADTSADTSCGCVKDDEKFCTQTWDFNGPPKFLCLADNTKHSVSKEGLIILRIGVQEIGSVRILSVNSKQWNGLFIGHDLI